MYNFVDTTEVSGGALLPAEALQINGEYIENLIDGYRTLQVVGREALSPEISHYETGVRDGSKLKNKRYPARTIIVKYQLLASTNEEFREKFNKLAQILDVKEAELIFADEQDKFFKGTPSYIGEVPAGRNSIVAEFELFCANPFKYSILEYEAVPTLEDGSVLIDYNGTHEAYPTLVAEFAEETDTSEDGETEQELTGGGDCGYVAFFNESEKIIQLGNPEETDGVEVAKSQTLVNSSFKKSTDWGTAAKKLWKVNSGITSSDAVVQAGNVGMGVASYTTPSSPSSTSGTLLNNKKCDSGSPIFYYTVKAKTSSRTENTVKVALTITASLAKDANFFGRGYGLKASVYIGGAWRSVTLKTTSEYWKGKSGHTKNITVTISGLSASTASLTGIKFKVERTDSLGKAGILSDTNCNNLAISAFETTQPENYFLTPSDYGSGANWHGASITRVIPADASGEVGAVNCTLSYSQKMSIGSGKNATAEIGAFQCLLVTGSGTSRKIVAGVNIYKGGSGKKANLRFYVNGKVVLTTQIDLSYNNQYFNSSKSTTIKKTGEKIDFNICGVKKSFKDDSLADVAVNEITFTMSRFGTKSGLSYNGLYYAKFIKNNCDTWKDIPNKFSAGDIVQADCNNAQIYLNGVNSPEYGALGNDWEGFCLTSGLNQIGFSYSEWCENPPSIKVRYREVFL